MEAPRNKLSYRRVRGVRPFSRKSPHPEKSLEWRALLLHARSLTQSAASKKWLTEAVNLSARIGQAEVLDAARRWLALGPTPGETTIQAPEAEANYQKGFVWVLGALGDTSIAPDIANFAFGCFRKIPMIGAVSHRVGNGCVNALAAMPGLDGVAQLSRLAARVKYDVKLRRLIEKAMNEAAERNQVSRDDLEAMAVPTFGLDASGVRIEQVADCEATLMIRREGASLIWNREGKTLRSAPASVKEEQAELLKDLNRTVQELDGQIAAQRYRLERQLMSEGTCSFERWKPWYLDHPVVSHFATRLIWEFEDGGETQTAIPWQGNLVDWAGRAVLPSPHARVRIWHPIRSGVQAILSWRCWLEDHQVRQPFKQAHREVYLLTDAERETETYSNRFASHIIRQHQFAYLCRERGWKFKLMGGWDSHNTPSLDLNQCAICKPGSMLNRRRRRTTNPPPRTESIWPSAPAASSSSGLRLRSRAKARNAFRTVWAELSEEVSRVAVKSAHSPGPGSAARILRSDEEGDCDLFVGVDEYRHGSSLESGSPGRSASPLLGTFRIRRFVRCVGAQEGGARGSAAEADYSRTVPVGRSISLGSRGSA